jgi:hypothetical protein
VNERRWYTKAVSFDLTQPALSAHSFVTRQLVHSRVGFADQPSLFGSGGDAEARGRGVKRLIQGADVIANLPCCVMMMVMMVMIIMVTMAAIMKTNGTEKQDTDG